MFENQERQASKKFYNKSSENSRSQIVFRTDIFRKLTLGAPEWIHCRFGKAVKGINCALMAGLPTNKSEDSIFFCLLVHVPPFFNHYWSKPVFLDGLLEIGEISFIVEAAFEEGYGRWCFTSLHQPAMKIFKK